MKKVYLWSKVFPSFTTGLSLLLNGPLLERTEILFGKYLMILVIVFGELSLLGITTIVSIFESLLIDIDILLNNIGSNNSLLLSLQF